MILLNNEQIIEKIRASKNASKLDLSNLNLTSIPYEIFELKNLQKLNLSKNKIRTVPKEISKLKRLNNLDLSDNNISMLHGKIFDLRKLNCLNLNRNNIKSIPKQISKLSNLRSLHIANNQIDRLPDELSETDLTELNISGNLITDFPAKFYELVNLKRIWLNNLDLKKDTFTSVRDNLKSLKVMYCYSYSKTSNKKNSGWLASQGLGNVISTIDIFKIKKKADIRMDNVKNGNKNKVFISYSHNDSRWLEQVQKNLKVLSLQGTDFETWDDSKIRGGDKWREEIDNALNTSQIAILIVSTDFLSSDFIINNELPPLLKKAQKNGVRILPLIVSPCRFIKTKELSVFQAINNPSKPLSGCSENEVAQCLVDLTDEVENCLN